MNETVFIGADHAGRDVKKELYSFLKEEGYHVVDCELTHTENDDYPDVAETVSNHVTELGGKGILICGTGTGMAIAANKINGVRAALAYDEYSARKAREDNDTNVLTLRAREFPTQTLKDITTTWLETTFSGEERHKRRIQKIHDLE